MRTALTAGMAELRERVVASELHHVEPFALGGLMTIENVQLRCRAGNEYEAEIDFGWFVLREEEVGYLAERVSSQISKCSPLPLRRAAVGPPDRNPANEDSGAAL